MLISALRAAAKLGGMQLGFERIESAGGVIWFLERQGNIGSWRLPPAV